MLEIPIFASSDRPTWNAAETLPQELVDVAPASVSFEEALAVVEYIYRLLDDLVSNESLPDRQEDALGAELRSLRYAPLTAARIAASLALDRLIAAAHILTDQVHRLDEKLHANRVLLSSVPTNILQQELQQFLRSGSATAHDKWKVVNGLLRPALIANSTLRISLIARGAPAVIPPLSAGDLLRELNIPLMNLGSHPAAFWWIDTDTFDSLDALLDRVSRDYPAAVREKITHDRTRKLAIIEPSLVAVAAMIGVVATTVRSGHLPDGQFKRYLDVIAAQSPMSQDMMRGFFDEASDLVSLPHDEAQWPFSIADVEQFVRMKFVRVAGAGKNLQFGPGEWLIMNGDDDSDVAVRLPDATWVVPGSSYLHDDVVTFATRSALLAWMVLPTTCGDTANGHYFEGCLKLVHAVSAAAEQHARDAGRGKVWDLMVDATAKGASGATFEPYLAVIFPDMPPQVVKFIAVAVGHVFVEILKKVRKV